MARRPILTWPHPVLSTPTQPVARVDGAILTLVDDLFETMAHADGIGLAANQVGVAQQVLVLDLDPTNAREDDPEWQEELAAWGYTGPLALINPAITARSGRTKTLEGCLSVPGFEAEVVRDAKIAVTYLNTDGKPASLVARGLLSVCIQHEMDHLQGRVFVERLPAPGRAEAARWLAGRGAEGLERDLEGAGLEALARTPEAAQPERRTG